MVVQFTDDNFEDEVIEASKEKPVLIDFFADWCGPCRMLAPVIKEIEEEIGDKAIIGKINTDESPVKSEEYGIQSIRDVKIFRNGEVVEDFVGVQPKDVLLAAIEKHL